MIGNNNAPHQTSASQSDLLAVERTKLANDRTILAYIRTSLTFFAAAAALIEFFDKNIRFEIMAYIAISFGVILLLVGFYNYYRSKKSIKAIQYIK